jgi:broad specificity phosphatase PhoE
METPLKLLFVRHGQSTGNVEKRMQGQGEYDLTPIGRQQAAQLALRLRSEGWHPTSVYSSPLRRALQTAEILVAPVGDPAQPLPSIVSELTDTDFAPRASEFRGHDAAKSALDKSELGNSLVGPMVDGRSETMGNPITLASELAEFQNGIFQGLTWAEAQAQYPDLCHTLEASPDWLQIPGAETLLQARQRSKQFVEQLVARHSPGDQVLIVSHSWILQHLIASLLGTDRAWRLPIHNTARFEFWVDQSRWSRIAPETRLNTDLWQIRRFNDDRHLAD